MEKRRLGQSDLLVSKLGLGCMSIGTDAKKAESILRTAFEEGINYFDSADLYDYGENEKIIGSSLKSVRDQVIIATKAGNRWNKEKDGWHWDPSKEYIKEAVKKSLMRLNTEYIDLYQLHGGTMDDPIEETIEAFEELKKEGYIRYYGISSIRPNVIREYVTKANIDSVMMQYSLLDRRPEEEALPLLHKHQISAVCRGSLAKGLLSDQMLAKASPSVKENGYLDYSFSELTELLPSLKAQLNRPFNEIALHYTLSHPAVASVIVGASSAMQLKENIRAASSKALTNDEIDFIRQHTKENNYTSHR
ncbi:aldo/keto reductase [Niallia endozanthoxylica]|uniref:Aldo/keto reductase n=1 Tax=Niallia endozanthoxylica TaxID=2036016 RepID=A0A5J5HWD9_9BACI|nr:aldo/keto reductase [Niallia endozanthoxylica]KAA9026197.1 aldo/keto reductase [Niallia endozanthoxylica]